MTTKPRIETRIRQRIIDAWNGHTMRTGWNRRINLFAYLWVTLMFAWSVHEGAIFGIILDPVIIGLLIWQDSTRYRATL